jgi:hypothetical protein
MVAMKPYIDADQAAQIRRYVESRIQATAR